MAHADYQDLMTMTEDMLKQLLIDVHGTETIDIPMFNINAKTITREAKNRALGDQANTQTIKLDFSGEFIKYDVMEELGLDPLDLGNLNLLRPKLHSMLIENSVSRSIALDMNDKQLFDKLIEARIESKAKQKPCFIMNHPLIMSPLAKSHAQGR